jgi:hypothetical protein
VDQRLLPVRDEPQAMVGTHYLQVVADATGVITII